MIGVLWYREHGARGVGSVTRDQSSRTNALTRHGPGHIRLGVLSLEPLAARQDVPMLEVERGLRWLRARMSLFGAPTAWNASRPARPLAAMRARRGGRGATCCHQALLRKRGLFGTVSRLTVDCRLCYTYATSRSPRWAKTT